MADWQKLGHSTDQTFAQHARPAYICRGCDTFNDPRWDRVKDKPMPPASCKSCGRMDFDFFPSQGEAKWWMKLRRRVEAGQIAELERQVRIPLLTVHQRTGKPVEFAVYVADFRWLDVASGERVTAEAKPGGRMTYESQIKIRCVEASGIPVTILT